MNRALRYSSLALVLAFASEVAGAEDLLLQNRPGEARIGPVPFPQSVSGVQLVFPASGFFTFTQLADKLQIDVRLVTDLSDVQGKTGLFVGKIPLPSGRCGLTVTIWEAQLVSDGSSAILTGRGDAILDTCSIFGKITQPYHARLPFMLRVADPHSITIDAENPNVVLDGFLSGATDFLSHIFGVDINAKVREAIEGAITANNLVVTIPADLQSLNPVVTAANFVTNSGALAATAQMRATLDAKALSDLVRALLKAPAE